ncbi:hypothetical protein D3H55_14225 [Bacillus salacetis]|uniref:DUF3902 family protein n=1 Tax=Bacillus salacetis TaxID=2315464 RepID=A0A3A1QYS3_9BACI|nr:hypothetical protein [Bacillus salacetis]RIW32028.1 hypothetical protein D3H55_14225 [Bacillus salacetis]
MTKKLWKSYTFLFLSILVTLTFIGIFVVGFGGGSQTLLWTLLSLIYIAGIASIIMGIWSCLSKLALHPSTIIGSVITVVNILLFFFFF